MSDEEVAEHDHVVEGDEGEPAFHSLWHGIRREFVEALDRMVPVTEGEPAQELRYLDGVFELRPGGRDCEDHQRRTAFGPLVEPLDGGELLRLGFRHLPGMMVARGCNAPAAMPLNRRQPPD